MTFRSSWSGERRKTATRGVSEDFPNSGALPPRPPSTPLGSPRGGPRRGRALVRVPIGASRTPGMGDPRERPRAKPRGRAPPPPRPGNSAGRPGDPGETQTVFRSRLGLTVRRQRHLHGSGRGERPPAPHDRLPAPSAKPGRKWREGAVYGDSRGPLPPATYGRR